MKLLPGLLALTATTCATILVASDTASSSERPASFRDDFSHLDRDRWFISDGWSNGDHQSCTWRAAQATIAQDVSAHIAGSVLRLGLVGAGDKWACAEVQARERTGHGLYEVLMRVEAGSGVVAAFFTYNGPSHGLPHNEIDIEILGRNSDVIQLNRYVDGRGENEVITSVPGGVARFVHYAFSWHPDRIDWYIDGELVHTAHDEIPAAPQRLHFSLWSGAPMLNAWLGPFDPAETPAALEIAWTAFTPTDAACAEPASDLCAGLR